MSNDEIKKCKKVENNTKAVIENEKEGQRPKQLRTLLRKYGCKTVAELDEYIEQLIEINDEDGEWIW